jgi:hypothetical protein
MVAAISAQGSYFETFAQLRDQFRSASALHWSGGRVRKHLRRVLNFASVKDSLSVRN